MDSDSEKRVKEKKAKLEDSQVTIMSKLPLDLIVEIISRLPIYSLVSFSHVCRSWRSLAREPSILQRLSQITQNSQCLMFHCDSPSRVELCCVECPPSADQHRVYNLYPNLFSSNLFSSMPKFKVEALCDGILCIFDTSFGNRLYLCNLLTNCMKTLPISVEYPGSKVLNGFGFLQKTNQYKVIQIVYYPIEGSEKPPSPKVFILTLGESDWRYIGSVNYKLVQCTSQVLVDGRLHWLSQAPDGSQGRSGNIVSFDLEHEKFGEVPKPDSWVFNKYEHHLLLIRGCLSAAFHRRRRRLEIWVMKNYGLKESWSKEYDIKTDVPRRQGAGNGNLDDISLENVRVLCILKNGEILLQYEGNALATYEPTSAKFKKIQIYESPTPLQVVHAGNLCWDCPLSRFDS